MLLKQPKRECTLNEKDALELAVRYSHNPCEDRFQDLMNATARVIRERENSHAN